MLNATGLWSHFIYGILTAWNKIFIAPKKFVSDPLSIMVFRKLFQDAVAKIFGRA